MDSDDEKPTRGKTRDWVKRRRDKGYFTNIIKELRVEDRFGFREMFRMDITDFEYVLAKMHVRIQKPKNGGSFYYNYKHTHSIILMAIAGPEYECLYADVG